MENDFCKNIDWFKAVFIFNYKIIERLKNFVKEVSLALLTAINTNELLSTVRSMNLMEEFNYEKNFNFDDTYFRNFVFEQ